MKWLTLLNLREIYISAILHNVDPLVIASIVSVESNGNPSATRYEKNYTYLYDVDENAISQGITIQTERVHQKTSWGLMQIMGANARVFGHKGPLSDLTKETVGLNYGVQFFKHLLDRNDDLLCAISSYNQGSARVDENGYFQNQAYVDKVMYRYNELKNIFNQGEKNE